MITLYVFGFVLIFFLVILPAIIIGLSIRGQRPIKPLNPNKPVRAYRYFVKTEKGLGPVNAPPGHSVKYNGEIYCADQDPTPYNASGVYACLNKNDQQLKEIVKLARAEGKKIVKRRVTAIPPVVVHDNGVIRAKGYTNIEEM